MKPIEVGNRSMKRYEGRRNRDDDPVIRTAS
jgi:hypothetical protein